MMMRTNPKEQRRSSGHGAHCLFTRSLILVTVILVVVMRIEPFTWLLPAIIDSQSSTETEENKRRFCACEEIGTAGLRSENFISGQLACYKLDNSAKLKCGLDEGYCVCQENFSKECVQSSNGTVHKKSYKDIESDGDELMNTMSHLHNHRYWKITPTNIQVYTVPRYPENYNAMLPLSLQQKLEGMSPREFLTYVLNDLTLEERESLMVDERQRRKSFMAGWPHRGDLSGNRMARAGFYSVDNYDRVQCVFCRGCLHQWDPEDNPMVEHRRSFNFCRFVKGLSCGNKEYRSNKLSNDDLRNVTKFRTAENGEVGDETDSGHLGISTNRAATVQYAPNATRLRTFSRWPASAPTAAQRMCDAGFYYTGFDDQVCCFYCDGGIKGWAVADDPWEQHACWFPDCDFLIHKKGPSYIDQVHSRTPANKKCVRKTTSQTKEEVIMVESRTSQSDMQTICKKLGHSSDVVQRAIELNGKPFDNIGGLVDSIYQLEEEEPGAADGARLRNIKKRFSIGAAINNASFSCPDDEVDSQQNQDAEIRSTASSTILSPQKYKQGCRTCELKTDAFVPATHVALPCGHLTYCDSCNQEEASKSSDLTYSVKCPFYQCNATLSGSIRVYFA